jgi:hypothetical protein
MSSALFQVARLPRPTRLRVRPALALGLHVRGLSNTGVNEVARARARAADTLDLKRRAELDDYNKAVSVSARVQTRVHLMHGVQRARSDAPAGDGADNQTAGCATRYCPACQST